MPAVHLLEILLVVCLLGAPLFLGLAAWDLQNDEAIYSYAVDRILETGEWLTPRSIPHDNAFLEKPPLKFWIVAAAIRAGVLPHDEFGLRFFDALFGALAFVYVVRLGQWLGGPGCGLVAGLVLFTLDSLVFDHGLRSNNMDAALFLAYCGGIYHFARWADGAGERRRGPHAIAVAGFFTLGFMTKFVAVLFLPLVCALAFAWRGDAGRRLRAGWRQWVAAAAVVLALVAPWFVYQTAVGGVAVWREMFGEHVYDRFTATLDPAHLEPWYFYFQWTWSELAFAGSHWLAALGLVTLAARAWTGQPWLARLVLVWWLVPAALLALTTSKLPHYIYPFMPPLALGAGLAAVTVFHAVNRRLAAAGAGGVRFAPALALVMVLLPLAAYPPQVKHLFTPGAPLRTLRDCASGPEPGDVRLYMSYWNRLMNHAFYYYLRGVGPWVETDRLDVEDLRRRLFDPARQTLAIVTLEDYETSDLTAHGRPSGIAFPERVVVLTPGRFAICGEAAVAAGGTPAGQAPPPRGRHWH